MSILKVIISFIIILYVTTFNAAIASTPEQEPSNVKVQSEPNDKPIDSSPEKEQQLLAEKTNTIIEKQQTETTSKSNDGEISKDKSIFEAFKSHFINVISNPTAIASVIAAFVGAIISSIGALVLGCINCRIEGKRQKHTEKMQKERNEQELLLLNEKNKQELLLLEKRNKQELQMFFFNKKLELYIKTRENIQNCLFKESNFLKCDPIQLVSPILMFCEDKTKEAISEYHKMLKRIEHPNHAEILSELEGDDAYPSGVCSGKKELFSTHEINPYLLSIDLCLTEEIKEIYKEIGSSI